MKTLSRYVKSDAARTTSRVAYKATADALGKVVTLAITVLSARALAPGEFGVLMLAMTTGWLLGVGSDAGLPLYLSRAVSRDGARSPLVPAVVRLRTGLAVLALIIGLVIASRVVGGVFVAAFALVVLAQVLGTMLETIANFFRGIGRSEVESSILIGQRMAVGTLTLAVLTWRPSLIGVALALLIPTAIAVLASLLMTARLRAQAADTPLPAQSRSLVAGDFLPIGLGVLLSALYFRVDVFFVERWHGLDAVGVYNAAFRLVESLRLFPAALLAVQFPVLVRAGDFRPLRSVMAILTVSGLALALVVYVVAPAALDTIYGDRFVAGTTALRVLALALPLFFINYALTHQVIAWDGQRAYLAITAVALVANLAGNTLLIPSGGMTGAALSTLITEVVVTAGCVLALAARKSTIALMPGAEAS